MYYSKIIRPICYNAVMKIRSCVLLPTVLASTLAAAESWTLKVVDLPGETNRHSVVAAGTPNFYNGHPTTILMEDRRTMFCFWPVNHGGHGGPAARSDDAGRTWRRIDNLMPAGMRLFVECPMAHRLVDPSGKERLWVWTGFKARNAAEASGGVGSAERKAAALNDAAAMPSVMSEDGGNSWREMPPLGAKFRCILPFQGLVRLKDGSTLGVYHRGPVACVDEGPLEIVASVTRDGGFTWSEPRVIAAADGLDLCEPWIGRSPDGGELVVLIRENTRKGASKMIFSRDEGATWTPPADVPQGLTGDRHQGTLLPDGRLVVCFRDVDKASPTHGHYVAWIGPYAALHGDATDPGYRVKLFHSHAGWDCGYSGVHRLADGTLVCTTYVKYRDDDRRQSVMTTRFNPSETDARR